MVANNSYSSDLVYLIKSNLVDYNYLIQNVDEYLLKEKENELIEEINDFCPELIKDLEILSEIAHASIEEVPFDSTVIEDSILCLINKVEYYYARKEYMNNFWECDSNYYRVTLQCINHILKTSLSKNSDTMYEESYKLKTIERSIFSKLVSRAHSIIENADGPVTKDYLLTVIEDLNDQHIFFVTKYKDILNYRGLYICDKNIGFLADEKLEIHKYLKQKLECSQTIHIDEIFSDLYYKNKDLMRRAYIKTPYHLFSFLEHYYSKDFSFARPFIATIGTKVEPLEQVNSYLKNVDEISVDDFIEYMRDNHIKIYSILSTIEEYNGLFVLKNRETLIRYNSTGIDHSIAKHVLDLIKYELEVDNCKAVRDLLCIIDFPKIAIPWDEWLIYSVVKKYGRSIEALTSSSQFKKSVPIVALQGKYQQSTIDKIAEQYSSSLDNTFSTISQLEDLDNLSDDLLLLEDNFDWSD